jgi:hypothetical protein
MTAEGTVTRPGPPIFNELFGYDVLSEPTPVYDGPMRVQRMQPGSAATPHTVADREAMIREYAVHLPLSVNGVVTAPVQANDLVTVTGCDDDPHMVGRALRVRDVRLGTLAWQRDLICEDLG